MKAGELLDRSIGGEQLGRHPVFVQGGPLLQLDAVEVILVVHPMRGQRAAANPPINSLFGDIQQASDVSNFELHGRS
jgi:hypothetical protein